MKKRQRGFEPVKDSMIKKGSIDPYYFYPQRGTEFSAGYDFKSPISFKILPGETVKVFTNIKAYMLNDEYLDINVRSAMAIKKNLRMKNSVGIIDSDYYENSSNDGNIIIAITNEGTEEVIIFKKERIAQGIFKKYLIIDDDKPMTLKRIGGVGSTDKNNI